MKIQIKDKKRAAHVNPPFIRGNIYKNLDNSQYYIGASSFINNCSFEFLLNVDSGNTFSSTSPFGDNGARFIDVTENSTFVVEI